MANCNSECEKTISPFVQLPLGHSATTFSSSSLEMLIDRSYDLLKAEDGVAVNVISTEEMFLLTSFSSIVLTFVIMNILTLFRKLFNRRRLNKRDRLHYSYYNKLFFIYVEKTDTAFQAAVETENAMHWLRDLDEEFKDVI